MAIRVQCHSNISKQATLLDGADVGPLKWCVCECGLNWFVHEGMNGISNVKVHLKTRSGNVNIIQMMSESYNPSWWLHSIWAIHSLILMANYWYYEFRGNHSKPITPWRLLEGQKKKLGRYNISYFMDYEITSIGNCFTTTNYINWAIKDIIIPLIFGLFSLTNRKNNKPEK